MKTFFDLLENQASVDALRHLLSLMYPSKCVACIAFRCEQEERRERRRKKVFCVLGSRTFWSLGEKSMEIKRKKLWVHLPLVRVHLLVVFGMFKAFSSPSKVILLHPDSQRRLRVNFCFSHVFDRSQASFELIHHSRIKPSKQSRLSIMLGV